MAKIISYDRNFVYIDEGDKMLEVKKNMVTFEPIPGREVIVHRNRQKEIINIELVEKVTKKEKVVEEKAKVQPVVEQPIEEKPTVEEPKVEEPIEEIQTEEPKPEEHQEHKPCKPHKSTRHTNRYIEIILGFLTILLFDGLFVAFAPFLHSIINLSILIAVVVVGIIFSFLALFLKCKKARFSLMSVIIIGYLLLFVAGIGLIFFESTIRTITYINSLYNRFPLLAFAGQALQFVTIIPAVLGIKYWISKKDYFNN